MGRMDLIRGQRVVTRGKWCFPRGHSGRYASLVDERYMADGLRHYPSYGRVVPIKQLGDLMQRLATLPPFPYRLKLSLTPFPHRADFDNRSRLCFDPGLLSGSRRRIEQKLEVPKKARGVDALT